MSASTSHKHYFKTGHLAETTIPPAREHAPDAGRHTQTLNPAYPTPYRYGTMPFYPVLYHHHIINRQTPFMPITLNPIRISSAKFIKAQTVHQYWQSSTNRVPTPDNQKDSPSIRKHCSVHAVRISCMSSPPNEDDASPQGFPYSHRTQPQPSWFFTSNNTSPRIIAYRHTQLRTFYFHINGG